MNWVCTFTCGHCSEAKPNMFGRGKARLERLEAYCNRPCYKCAVAAVPEYVCSLTASVKTGEKYNLETGKEKIQQRINKLYYSYLMTINE